MAAPRRTIFVLAAACALAFPAGASATAFQITGTMEGNITIANGDDVVAGYSFAINGAHPQTHVLMANASVVIQGACSNGSAANTLVIPLRAGADSSGTPYDV